jgi:CspA family cold shock protein
MINIVKFLHRFTRKSKSIMQKGSIKFFNESKGFGFITPQVGGKDIFVHATGLNSAKYKPKDGDDVVFEVEEGKKGPVAVNVQEA